MSRARCLVMALVVIAISLGEAGGQKIQVETRARIAGQVQKGDPIGYAESHALVIGVSNYEKWKKLPGVMRDIEEVGTLLKQHGFRVETVVDPTRPELVNQMEKFISNYGLKEKNRLVIYFAGHGHTRDLRDERQAGYIVMKDAPLPVEKPEEEMTKFIRSVLSMDEIETFAKRVESKHAMFVFDSCFSGSLFRSEERPIPPMIASKAAESVRQFITSGTAKQEVPDESKFRKYFVRGLEGEADANGDGYVTGEELGVYLTGKVSEESGNTQTPRYGKIKDESLNRGDMVFVVRGREVEKVKASPVEVVQTALDPGKSEATEDSDCQLAWKEIKNSKSINALESFLKDCGESTPAKAARIRLILIREGERKIVEPTRETEETETWKIVAATKDPEELRKFIAKYPEGSYKTPAEFRLGELEAEIARIEAERKPLIATTRGAFTSGSIVNGNLIRKQGECEVYTEDLGNGVLLEMVKVPGGDFLMGEDGAGATEFWKECKRVAEKAKCTEWAGQQQPQHWVRVKEFLMGKYEVTQRQWRAVMGGLPAKMEKMGEKFKGEEKPVVAVSWEEVREFISKLGKGYRLPSEAEWEYAARGGMRSAYGFGDEITPDIVNYNGKFPAGKTKKGVNREAPVLVGSLGIANQFGLYDMHGNVWEWCEDEAFVNYKGAPVDGSAWVSSVQSALRVIRGGSWSNNAVYCRSAHRIWITPGRRGSDVGFRLSRTLPSALLPSGRD